MLIRVVLLISVVIFGCYFLLLAGSTAQCLFLPEYEPTGGNTLGLISKRDPCLSKTAANFRLKGVCNFAYKKDSCLGDYAETTNSVDECKKLTGTQNQDYCIRNVAVVHTKNPDICLFISDDIFADNCLMDLSEKVTDITYCDKFRLKETSFFYAKCLANVAKNTHNPSICESVQKITIFEVDRIYKECLKNSQIDM